MEWTYGGQARREPAGPKPGRPNQLGLHFKGTGIDTGLILYRYPLQHTRTESMGIDTGLLLYRYRELDNPILTLFTDFDFVREYKYPVFGAK